MNIDFVLLCTEAVIVLSALFAMLYSFGIVWRVEEELDISFKFFSLAITFFLISELLHIYYSRDGRFFVVEMFSRAFFSVSFLVGIVFMRDIVRKLDGEKKEKQRSRK